MTTVNAVPRKERAKPPDRDQMRTFVSRGLTQQQIVDAWFAETGEQMTRAGISMAMKRYGIAPAHLETTARYRDDIPWSVREEHNDHYDYKMLRQLARRRAGKRLAAGYDQRLDAWLRDLEEANAVVLYDPATPDGFYWVPREPQDGDSVVRRPEG